LSSRWTARSPGSRVRPALPSTQSARSAVGFPRNTSGVPQVASASS
jgi:hypothetical protein